MKRIMLALLLGALGAAAMAEDAEENVATVRRLFEAFNAHSVDGIASLVTDDVAWSSVDGSSIAVEAEGKEALRASMLGYFGAVPTVRSEIEDLMVSGKYVIARERVYWEKEGKERSQSALAVYECRDDRIARVWYFPAED